MMRPQPTTRINKLIDEENWDELTRLIVRATDDPFVSIPILFATLFILESTTFPKDTLARLRKFFDAIPD